RIVGVVEVDLDLDGLVERLRRIRPGGGAVYLVNQKGQVVAHPDLKAVADLGGSANLGSITELMRHHGEDTIQAADPIGKMDSWLVETPISALSKAQGGNDWALIVSWPLKRRLAPLGEMARRMIVLYAFLGGTALLFLQRSFDAVITRPLRALAEQARRYARGDYSWSPPPRNEAPELRELSYALEGLGKSLAKATSRVDQEGRT
ncbi:MAG TPA: hypothetical protein VMK12_30105, partial [Anaeromyxobacteraceae bacterium]|nr:hypothetical protein [Anaeromyxobacteraceae bacterium]